MQSSPIQFKFVRIELFMKKIILLVCTFLTIATLGAAQETSSELPTTNASNVFLELGANGGFLSLNYDTRFSKTGKGLGLRAGIGFIPPVNIVFFETPIIITFPVALNYLAGKGPHYWEGGAGVTFATYKTDLFGEESSGTGVAFVPSIGYRYMPLRKGFTGRVIISPFIGSGGTAFWAGVSGGIRF